MTQTLYLSFQGGISDAEAFAVQGDRNLSSLRCVLRGYRYRNNDTALLRATKPDGTVCYLTGTHDTENAFRFILTEQITDLEGDARCDIALTRGNGIISTDEFLLKIRPAAASGDMTNTQKE